MARPPLAIVVAAEFLVLGLWFSGTAVVPDLREAWALSDVAAAAMTTLVIAGFVVGTVSFAVLYLSDRFPARVVFAASAWAGAAAMAALIWQPGGVSGALSLRFFTGVALAGVYPVGMKILASWYARPSFALSLMVAALTFGSGSPFLVRGLGLPWQATILTASALAVLGGALVLIWAPSGPRLPAKSAFKPTAFAHAFAVPRFRRAALAYFGHMWELYALWSLLPVFLLARGDLDAATIALLAFTTFLGGLITTIATGLWSRRVGEARVGRATLVTSTLFCLASPLTFTAPVWFVAPFVFLWGGAAVADSPQFSAIATRVAPQSHVGTALTIQNAIGFAIAWAATLAVPLLASATGWRTAFWLAAVGPALGAWAIWRDAQADDHAAHHPAGETAS